jgi:hypothetical protein
MFRFRRPDRQHLASDSFRAFLDPPDLALSRGWCLCPCVWCSSPHPPATTTGTRTRLYLITRDSTRHTQRDQGHRALSAFIGRLSESVSVLYRRAMYVASRRYIGCVPLCSFLVLGPPRGPPSFFAPKCRREMRSFNIITLGTY